MLADACAAALLAHFIGGCVDTLCASAQLLHMPSPTHSLPHPTVLLAYAVAFFGTGGLSVQRKKEGREEIEFCTNFRESCTNLQLNVTLKRPVDVAPYTVWCVCACLYFRVLISVSLFDRSFSISPPPTSLSLSDNGDPLNGINYCC